MESNKVSTAAQNNLKLRRLIYWVFGILETLLAFRLVFKLLGANPRSIFVELVYNISGVFLTPFRGIFHSVVTNGLETKAVLEPATIIAMIVYALLAYGCVKLVEILVKSRQIEIVRR